MADTDPEGAALCEDLIARLDAVWARLEAAPVLRKAPFRQPVLATLDEDGRPVARMVVLRAVDRGSALLQVHTDERSAKVAQIRADDRVAVLFWDPSDRLQVRAEGRARVVEDADRRAQAWEALGAFGQGPYHLPLPPGTPVADRAASKEAGRPRDGAGAGFFTVIEIILDRLDALTLARGGHERAVFERSNAHWTGRWVAP